MENRRKSRNLKQTRAFNTKKKILEVAYKLFCENGYYKTNSIEIAKIAGISIGCFYSYFKDKDAVFYEILDLYNKNFLEIVNNIPNITEINKGDKKEGMLLIANKLIMIHESSKDLNRELNILYNSNTKVASVVDEQHKKIRNIIREWLCFHENDIKVTDIDSAIIIIEEISNSIINRIVFKKDDIDSNRILNAGIEAINKYLFSEKY